MPIRRAALAILCFAAAAVTQEPPPPAPAPIALPATFAGRDAAAWAQRVKADTNAATAELATGKVASLPMLRELLASPDHDVANAAARACAAIGADAAPLVPVLAAGLRDAPSWWTQLYCADALAAIGVADNGVLATLLERVCRSDVAHLRQVCAVALARLADDAPARLLAAAAAGEFAKPAYAVDAFVSLGERSADALIAAVRAGEGTAELARDALVQIGWRIVPQLERASLRELADRVLIEGPLRHVTFADGMQLELTSQPPPIDRLPDLVQESAGGHGDSLRLVHAAADARGLQFTEITITVGTPDTLVVRSATMPRTRAHALMRQLVTLAHVSLPDRPAGAAASSSGDFHALVRLTSGGAPVLDTVFCGYPSSTNAQQRFRAQAADAILWEALDDATWTVRAPTAADREFVTTRQRDRPPGEPAWVTDRLAKLRQSLEPR